MHKMNFLSIQNWFIILDNHTPPMKGQFKCHKNRLNHFRSLKTKNISVNQVDNLVRTANTILLSIHYKKNKIKIVVCFGGF